MTKLSLQILRVVRSTSNGIFVRVTAQIALLNPTQRPLILQLNNLKTSKDSTELSFLLPMSE
jgi:hypothetical protein